MILFNLLTHYKLSHYNNTRQIGLNASLRYNRKSQYLGA